MIEISESENNRWDIYRNKILDYLVTLLQRIEWYYGDNRAPFRYPPEFSIQQEGTKNVYTCIIREDMSENNQEYHYQATSPKSLFEDISSKLGRQFNLSEEICNPDRSGDLE